MKHPPKHPLAGHQEPRHHIYIYPLQSCNVISFRKWPTESGSSSQAAIDFLPKQKRFNAISASPNLTPSSTNLLGLLGLFQIVPVNFCWAQDFDRSCRLCLGQAFHGGLAKLLQLSLHTLFGPVGGTGVRRTLEVLKFSQSECDHYLLILN